MVGKACDEDFLQRLVVGERQVGDLDEVVADDDEFFEFVKFAESVEIQCRLGLRIR